MNITPWVLAFQGVNLLLQLAVMYFALQCDKRYDKVTTVGTKAHERAKWWGGITMGALTLFCMNIVLWFATLAFFVLECAPKYNQEVEIKCKTIEGEFSRRLDACYKEGVKINFNESEMTYGE